ncbi:MAG TPA: dephospho-CoA kinase [Gemmatimonadota bacterium]|nr:dephospho-CoA kinase [Gemmatimonadota bacterium]
MMTVGLTGNVASGKTTVADRWRESGVTVIDADRLGHAVLEEDAEAREALVREFGGGILGPDGRIDRRALGEAAFSVTGRVASLNAIVHPPLLERLDRELEQARESGAELAVVDAALVFEFGLGEVLDAIVLVTAPARIREERLREARGMDAERIARIMETQMPDEEKVEACDYVIVNDGSIDRLRAEADAVLAAIRDSMDEYTGGGQDDG